jgi:hypothetical protein
MNLISLKKVSLALIFVSCSTMPDRLMSVALQGRTFSEGDILCTKGSSGKYTVSKILRLEKVAEGQYGFHQMIWDSFDSCPSLTELKAQQPFIMHAPILRTEQSPLGEILLIGHEAVSANDLEGYNEYRKQMGY